MQKRNERAPRIQEPRAQYKDPIEWEDAVLVPRGLRRQTRAWRAAVKAIYGSPLTDDELVIYKRLSGGVEPPVGGSKRVLIIGGRRGGKSSAAGRIATFEATQRDHGRYLEPGQIGSVSILAQDLSGATQVVNYAQGLAKLPEIAHDVADIPVETVLFRRGLRLEKVTASEQAVRSRTAVFVVADEIAYWDSQGPDEDRKVMAALTPSLLASDAAPTRRLIAITSAGYTRGWAYETYSAYHGVPDAPWLVLSGSTLDFRPDLDPAEIDADCAGNPQKKAREYESRWSNAVAESYFDEAKLRACVDDGVRRTEAEDGVRYHVAIDPSFQRDLFAIAVACSKNLPIPSDPNRKRQRQTEIVYCDAWQPRPNQPLSPAEMAARVAAVCARFGTRTVYSDQHAAIPLAEALRSHGIRLVKRVWHAGHAPDSKANRFEAVREAVNGGTFRMLDDKPLLTELLSVVSEPMANNGIRISGSAKHDDRAHAAVMAASEALAAAPSTPAKSLTRWERQERDTRWARLRMAIGA